MNAFVEGVRDILPAELRKRRAIYQTIREVFEANAYREVITPTLESLELYAGIEGLVDKSEMFKVVDDKGQILVLRPDLTMPIARLAASRFQDSPRPLKFSYLSSAFQSKNSQSLSLKEKTQAGVELIGSDGLESDLEMILLLIKTMQKVGVEEPLVDIGHADLINEIFADLNIAETEKSELRQLLAAKNKVGIKNYIKDIELTEDAAEVLLRLPSLFGAPKKVVKELEKMPLSTETKDALKTLEKLFNKLEEFEALKYITFDPMLISRHGYYTGLIFKGYAKGYSNLLASGGRYDNLTEKFGVEEPAVGFALEIENLLDYLNRTENFSEDLEKRFLISYQQDKDFKLAYELAEDLRNAGFVTEVYNGAGREYLDFQQIDFVISLQADQLELKQYGGSSAEIERNQKEALEYLILNKIEEWE
ncbi:ATP phosphoribosyltransferase regulatory subunit [Halanaerobium saccharolyticum]|uniref:ATP phosphoribosyltransferase regulatory subunit n=1 Tax=Halanaerobium saccharolyticum TaxID=43595 RepID=A0A4R7Z8U5_9FIRM|nr:ATP phosphoribosyltransferase regulatory subunit [Halanaerobium saccharolyticum]RAK11699.1 ATP phosphoribosyltransferase regulatory subunit [Halanaerobium saccharolyticum]TDW07540.1 ATP phosphoribosyltransferase regulatory subunit [Halanaerobium saccharolyticum]TDX64461.1 ATP phosphoribosyltransferase regulatory subunit [Halanaerobium saccharolyticum]